MTISRKTDPMGLVSESFALLSAHGPVARTYSARINITEAEMGDPVIVCKKKPYIKTIEQENDPSIKNYVIVERQRIPEDTPLVLKCATY